MLSRIILCSSPVFNVYAHPHLRVPQDVLTYYVGSRDRTLGLVASCFFHRVISLALKQDLLKHFYISNFEM